MREAVFILVVLLVILGLTAYRYRRQIGTMLNLYRMMKSMRQMNKPANNRIDGDDKSSGPLVNCAKCGTWVPENRAIKLRGNTVFCSAECLETSQVR